MAAFWAAQSNQGLAVHINGLLAADSLQIQPDTLQTRNYGLCLSRLGLFPVNSAPAGGPAMIPAFWTKPAAGKGAFPAAPHPPRRAKKSSVALAASSACVAAT
jgi:hypothetical protein